MAFDPKVSGRDYRYPPDSTLRPSADPLGVS